MRQYKYKKTMLLLLGALFAALIFMPAAAAGQGGITSLNTNTADFLGYQGFPAGIDGEANAKFSGGVADSNSNVWMIPSSADRVVRLNTATGAMTGYASWPSGFDASALYKFRGGVLDDNGGLWMIPNHVNQIVKLDTATGAMTGYNNWPAGFNGDETSKFYGGVYYNGGLWLIPSNADRAVRLDTSTGVMTGYDNWPAGLDVYSVKFFGGAKDAGGNLWMAPCNASMAIKLDMSTGAMTGYSAFPAGISPTDTEKFSGGVYDGAGNIWLIPNSANQVVRLNTATGEMTGYDNWPAGVPASLSNKFSGGTLDDSGNIWLTPQKAGSVVKLDISTGEMTGYNVWPNGFNTQSDAKFAGSVFDSNNIWLIPYSANKIIQVLEFSEMALSLSAPGVKVYAGADQTVLARVTGKKPNSTIQALEYFITKTNDTTVVTDAGYTTGHANALHKGLLSQPATVAGDDVTFNIPATQNGVYHVRLTVQDASGLHTTVEKITVDNIYTPCLYVKGVDTSGNQLYNERYSAPHGVPVEFDGTLIARPGMGFDTVKLTAKNLDGYSVSGTGEYTVVLDGTGYLNQPGNTYTFPYTPLNKPAAPPQTVAPKPPEVTPPKADPPQVDNEQPGENPPPEQKTPAEEPTQENHAPESEATEVLAAAELADFGISTPAQESAVEKVAQDIIVCSLTAIANKAEGEVYRYMVIDKPSANLQFITGSIPAFTKGEGLSYSVLYKTNTGSYKTAASGIPADCPYSFTLPSLPQDQVITEITVFFDKVPAGFGADNVIKYTFRVMEEAYSNQYYTYWNAKANSRADVLALLQTTVNDCLSSYKQQDYDPQSWERLMSAVGDAQQIMNDPYSTADQIRQAHDRVNAAINGLESLPTKEKADRDWIYVTGGLLLILVMIIPFIIRAKRRKKRG